MRIFLIGFMGSGKTTIGKLLANQLGYDFIDMDDYLVRNQGRTINEIFEKEGEDKFREIERNILHEMFSLENKVIGSGGGSPCFFDNMDQMNKHGETFYLKIDTNGLVRRLLNATSERPLLKGKSEYELTEYIDNMLVKREPFYKKAKHVIQAENMKVEDFFQHLKYNN